MFGAGCQQEACGEQDLSAVWTSPLVGVWVFGAGCQHDACREQDLSAVWSSPLAGVWVFGPGCQHEACGEQDNLYNSWLGHDAQLTISTIVG